MHPSLRKKIAATIAEARKQGLNVALYETGRRQNWLHKHGKSKLRGNRGLHTKGFAADIVFKDKNGNWMWKASKSDWKKLGEIGKKHGLTFGGDWKRFKDEPHFQLKP